MDPRHLARIRAHRTIAHTIVATARQALEREGEIGGGVDPSELAAMVQVMLNLWLEDERRAPFCTGLVVPQGSVPFRLEIVGWHLPGLFNADGIPELYVAPPGVKRGAPPDALPVCVLVPQGREHDAARTWPRIAPASGETTTG